MRLKYREAELLTGEFQATFTANFGATRFCQFAHGDHKHKIRGRAYEIYFGASVASNGLDNGRYTNLLMVTTSADYSILMPIYNSS